MDATPSNERAHDSATVRFLDRSARDSSDFTMLRVITILLPIIFIVGLEAVRQVAFDETPRERALGGTLLLVAAIGVVLFSTMVLRIIGRTQRQLHRRNRELAAANAVSVAVRGAYDLDTLLDAALDSVLAASGAVEASIITFRRDTGRPGERQTIRRRTTESDEREHDGESLEIPLTTGATTLGSLRLRFAADVEASEVLATETLETIGQQLAGAIQTAELLEGLHRGMAEGHAFYDVLLQISNQNPLPDTLAAIIQHLRSLLRADEAALTINSATARSLQSEGEITGAAALGDGSLCVSSDDAHFEAAHDHAVLCPVRSLPRIVQSASLPVRGAEATFGDLWLGRHEDEVFNDADRRFMGAMAEVASIAITNARLFEQLRQSATVAERERIAREMHDGMAQVLGVTHLRLRALESVATVRALPDVHEEVSDLADLCSEAYRDVRESILGLRESSRVDRALLESLRVYIEKYERQSGITTLLDTDVDEYFMLPPRYQVQLLRVVQESLTNVRKHAQATQAVVRVHDDGLLTTFVIEDNGTGFDMSQMPSSRDGFGLHSMRERLDLLGGTLTIDSTPGSGTRVIATVPSAPQAHHAPQTHHATEIHHGAE